LQKHFDYTDYSEVIDWQLKQIGSSWAEMVKKGVTVWPREESDMYLKDGEYFDFGTNTGMIELYATALEDEGFDPLPNYTAHPEPQEGYFRLNYGRAPMHTFARTSNNPQLNDLMDENSIWVNPKIAKEHGIGNGQYIWLKNQDGVVSSSPAKVRLTERIGMDNIYMVHGFGHTDKRLKKSYHKGICDTELITNVCVDPIMGGTGMRNNFVTFVIDEPRKEVIS
jgi:thiosulfate reductase/polysulfide reductase chain A